MAFKANIPLATDKLSTSQSDIEGNFQEINTYVNVDHIAFNGANQGKHKKATFPVAAAPGAVGAAEVGIYAANHGGIPELFINKTATQIPFTACGPLPLAAASGWTYLPSGLILQWGSGWIPGGTQALYVAYAIPFPTLLFSCTGSSGTQQVPASAVDSLLIFAAGAAGVTISRDAAHSGNGSAYAFIAIGY